MKKIFDFFGSGLLGNVIAIVGLVIALLPQKDSVSIDNSQTYIFEGNGTGSTKDDQTTEFLKGAAGIFLSYILYALLQPYFTFLLLLLSFCVVIKYRRLKIAHLSLMVVPAIFIVTSMFLPSILPDDVINYWDNAYKINFQQINSISQVFDQLWTPFIELKNVLFSITESPLSVAVLANIIFALFTTSSMIIDLLKRKREIKVVRKRDIIVTIIFLFILLSFMRYTEPTSLARHLVERITHFLTN